MTSSLLERVTKALGGRYLVEREVGSGGMATVYLAQDLRHQRRVAVKVFRPELAATLGGDRFFREIQIAAQLQHPNILPLLDSGEAEGFLYYVMPFVEGESLRERLTRHGELPIADAVRILQEVADALAHAHAAGVVHRDIKPDNILMSGRHALVTDFGVAKAVSEATGRQSLTTAGVALGTPTYMAPEQAAADPNLDARADIYALGVVGYELLAGRPPFTGTSSQSILSAHLTQPPQPIAELRSNIPQPLAEAVMRCLEKRPADRWQHASELVSRLEALATPGSGVTPSQTRPVPAVAPSSHARRAWLGLGLVGALGIVGVLAAGLFNRRATPLALGARSAVTLAPGMENNPVVSPDGKLVAYTDWRDGEPHIVVQQLAGGSLVTVTPDWALRPTWSADGTRLLVVTRRGLEVVPALGGPAKLLVPSEGWGQLLAGALSPDGRELAYTGPRGLFIRGVDSGTARHLGEAEQSGAPAWSSDGRWIAWESGNILYDITGNLSPMNIWVVPAAGGTPVRVTDHPSINASPVWVPGSRKLLFVSNREGSRDIYEVELDRSGGVSGAPRRITTGLNAQTISLSGDGRTLVYTLYSETSNVHVIPRNAGRSLPVTESRPVTAGSQVIEGIAISPDGKWLVFDSDRAGNQDLWRMALPTGALEQITSGPDDDFLPDFSPDGRELVFHRIENGVRDVFVMPSAGGTPVRLTTDPGNDAVPRWQRDGKGIFYRCGGRQDIVWLNLCSMSRSESQWGAAQRVADSSFSLSTSPDNRWVAVTFAGSLRLLPRGGGTVRYPYLAGDSMPQAGFTAWAPDSRTVYFTAFAGLGNGQFSLRSVDVDGGAVREVMHVRDPSTQSNRFGIAVHGDSLYFSYQLRSGDIWMAKVLAQ